MICGCSYFLVFNTVLHSVWNIYCWVEGGGSHPFYRKLRGEAQSFVNFKKGIRYFPQNLFPFSPPPPSEIKNDNSLKFIFLKA